MNDTGRIRVAVFEDNPIMMDAYRSILNGSPGYVCCGGFTSASSWRQNVERTRPEVVLMDIEMNGLDGIAATQLIKKEFPLVRILIQTVFEDDDKIMQALCAGADGYILKTTAPVKMLEAIADVKNGGVAFTPAVAAKVALLFQKYVSPAPLNPDYQLTQREKEILRLLTEGQLMPKIAASLFLSYETVRSYVKSIYQKLHVASATEAVAKALKERLI